MARRVRETDDPLGKKLLLVLREKNHADDLNELAKQLNVKVQSTYDYIKHGRIAKDRYPLLVKWSGRSLDWWFDVPKLPSMDQTMADETDQGNLMVCASIRAMLPYVDFGRVNRLSSEEKSYLQGVINSTISEIENRREQR